MSSPGKKWEAIGFIMIVAGMFTGMGSTGEPLRLMLGTLGLGGFVVFIIGRFK